MKRHLPAVVAFGAFLCLASPAHAECRLPAVPATPDGFFRGQNLAASSDDTLSAYLGGYLNGIFFSIVLGADEECVFQAQKCVGTIKGADLVRILRNYITADPRRLSEWASTVTFNALFSQCFKVEYGGEPPTIEKPTPS